MNNSEFLREVILFADLTPEERAAVAALLIRRAYRRHQVLFLQDDPGDYFYIVRSGSVKVYKLAEDGREKILQVFTRGDFFGEMALLDMGGRSAGAETLEPTVLLLLAKEQFSGLLRRYPGVALRVIEALSRRLRLSNAQVESFAFQDARGRLITTLLDLADRHGLSTPEGLLLNLRLTHQDLAGLAGTSRETVTRLLAELEVCGLLVFHGRQITISSCQGLAEWRNRQL